MTDRERRLDPALREAVSREAGEIQRRGADPDVSVIVRASAGAGKTKVLIDRLVRLLLSGRPVKSVVAMTFTRKAAVEIKDRLLRKVGALASLEGEALEAELGGLLHRAPSPAETARAARLVEDLLEDPSGLHVGTIHTFCQTLLTHFADEAGVDPTYGVLEDPDELWSEALDLVERDAVEAEGGPAAWATLGSSPDAARKRLDGLLHLRMELDRWAERVSGADRAPERLSYMHEALVDDLRAHLFDGTPLADADDDGRGRLLALAAERAEVYAGAGLDAVRTADEEPTDAFLRKTGERSDQVRALIARLESGDESAFATLMADVLTQKNEPRKLSGGKKFKEAREAALAEITVPLQELAVLDRLLDLLDDNETTLRFGLAALDRYEDLKRRDRVLDFHDLEVRARGLVRDPDLGHWIVYRMDARLDHLLVDEFQDTNRNQWDLIAPFAEEFTAGADDEGRPRTAFFVGDVKQSIYRFRGACPEIFGETVDWLGRVREEPLLTLPANFRSLPAVVETVGEAFRAPPLDALLPDASELEAVAQKPFRDDAPGCVTVHPLDADDENGISGHEQAAARAVAVIRDILARGVVAEEGEERPAGPGDVLMLCRNRTHVAEYERALRNARLPYVPAGRGALARSREVMDVLALLRWLTFPADGVALATALRSPLFRIVEDVLQRAVAGARRGAGLWAHMRSAARPDELADAADVLGRWLGRVGLEPCHDLLRRIYRDTLALDRFEAALGEQARFNLLRLHDLALEHDAGSFPSLRGFVRRIERAAVRLDQEEATLPDTERGRIQMLTIHGAKGLESPFVLLVDAGAPLKERLGRVLFPDPRGRGALATGVTAAHRGVEGAPATDLSRAAVAALLAERREEANLLYVAMTRARDELHVLGAAPTQNANADSHHRWLCRSLGLDEGEGRRGEPLRRDRDAAAGPPTPPDAAPHATWTPVGGVARGSLVSPSSLEGPAPGTGVDATAAAVRGTLIHLWLQRAAEAGVMPLGSGEAWEEARAVFENPRHDAVFRPGPEATALCEVDVLHRTGDDDAPRWVRGQIDRLIVTPERVLIVDYKTNAVDAARAPELLEHYRPQLEAYAAAMSAAYPDRVVESALLLTHPGPDDDRGAYAPLP